jgi:hypothetical protein
MDSSLLQLPICLVILIFLESLPMFNFHFSVIFCNRFSTNFFIYLKHNTISFIFSLLYQTLLLHTFPMFCMIPVLSDVGDGPLWISSVWLQWFSYCSVKDCSTLDLLLCLYMFVFYSHCCPTGNNGDILSTAVFPHARAGLLQTVGCHFLEFTVLFVTHPLPHTSMCLPFISTVMQTLG